jgi:hypothetical protein
VFWAAGVHRHRDHPVTPVLGGLNGSGVWGECEVVAGDPQTVAVARRSPRDGASPTSCTRPPWLGSVANPGVPQLCQATCGAAKLAVGDSPGTPSRSSVLQPGLARV